MGKTTNIYYKNLADIGCLELASPKKCAWHRGLPSFFGYATSKLSEVFNMQSIAEFSPPLVTAKTCPAVLNMLKTSLLVKAPCDIVIKVQSTGSWKWITPSTFLGVQVNEHPIDQLIDTSGHYKKLFNNKIVLKIELPTLIRVKDKLPYIFTQPHFHNNLPIQVIQGPVPTPYSHSRGNPLTILYLVDSSPGTYTIQRGDVLAYIWGGWDSISLKEDTDLKEVVPKTFLSRGAGQWV